MIIAPRHQPNIIMLVQKLLNWINVFVMKYLQDGSSETWSLHPPTNYNIQMKWMTYFIILKLIKNSLIYKIISLP